MPHIELMTPDGYWFRIASRERETLRRWFDEILPHAFVQGRPIDDFTILWPRVHVLPMWSFETKGLADPDWLTDSRVLGRMHELAAVDGDQALALLDQVKTQLLAELVDLNAKR